MAIDKATTKRWTKISLWISYWWLVLASGGLMMLVDIISNRVWLVQIRGLSIFMKLFLLALLGVNPLWDDYLLAIIIIISGVISHAHGKLRYYSVYHRKVMSSTLYTKG